MLRRLFSLIFASAAFLSSISTAQQFITTVAGGGPNGLTATSANIRLPWATVPDNHGAFYIADLGGRHIFKVGSNGLLTNVAGNGTPFPYQDGALAVSVGIEGPSSVAVDGGGNLFVANYIDNQILPSLQAASEGTLFR